MTELHKITLTAKIYSKACPNCRKDNLESSAFCWNCGYEFEDFAHGEVREANKNFWSSLGVQIAFIAAVIVLILIILDVVR